MLVLLVCRFPPCDELKSLNRYTLRRYGFALEVNWKDFVAKMPGLFRRVQGMSFERWGVFKRLELTVSCFIANQDSLSDEALMPLKTYKYQSVDLSYISRYVLKHYVQCPWRV